MADNEAKSAVNFQSEQSNVEFQPESEAQGAGVGERISEAAQAVNWNKVGIGVGAAAAVAGAAYAAKKFAGRGGDEGGGQSSGGSGKQS